MPTTDHTATPAPRAWPIRPELRALLTIALPIMVTQLAQNGLSMVDVLMAGNVSPAELAGVSIGSAFWTPVFLFIVGVLVVLSALIAHAHGQGDTRQAAFLAHQGSWLGLGLGLTGWWLCQNGHWFVDHLALEPGVRDTAIAYLAAVSWSAPAVGLYQSLRCHCEGASRTRPVMLLACVAFLINIPLDYLFVFGGLGIPALGGEGCGWATSLVCWITLTLAWWYVRHQGARQRLPMLHSQWVAPQLPKLRYLLTLGIPVGLAIFFEVSLFSLVSIMVSRYGTETLAGHQVAYSVTSSIYMIPLAIGMAISVRTGFLLGAGEPRHARFAAFCGIALAGLSALATGALLLLLRTPIASLYSDNETVLTLAAHLMVLAVLFQVPDALQVSLSGALRAYRDTRAIMLATALAYWVIGLPLGMALAEGVGGLPPLGVTGYWSGLIAGLSAAAVLLALRLRRTARRHATSRPP